MLNLPARNKEDDEAVVWKWTLKCQQQTVVIKCKLKCKAQSVVTKRTFKCVQFNVSSLIVESVSSIFIFLVIN